MIGLFGRRRRGGMGLGGRSEPEEIPPCVPLDETTPTVHYEGGDQVPGTCARASGWCDGRVCRDHGVDCPYAEGVTMDR